jgi:hypothetical protein
LRKKNCFFESFVPPLPFIKYRSHLLSSIKNQIEGKKAAFFWEKPNKIIENIKNKALWDLKLLLLKDGKILL